VLTGLNHHHRYLNGQIEHTFQPGRNTSAYPSAPDDDHPSIAGSRKATEEFIPLLNIFYQRWKAAAPFAPPAAESPTAQSALPSVGQPVVVTRVLDDFESGALGWDAFTDEIGGTTMACVSDPGTVHGGTQAMRGDYKVGVNGWATCAHFYDSPQNWDASKGITFYLHTAKAGQAMHVDLYAQAGDERETYVYAFETTPESVSGWVPIRLRWEDFRRVEWEANAGAPFSKIDQVAGMAFGLPSQDAVSEGQFWVDDLALLAAAPVASTPLPVAETPTVAPPGATQFPVQPAESTPARPAHNPLGCAGSAALPLIVFAGLWLVNRKH